MAGPEHREMAPVQGREHGLVEPLDHGKDSGVDEPNVKVGKAMQYLSDADVIINDEVFDAVGATCDVREQGGERYR